ncbi:MAG TPA: UDP-glucose/GDP-mannose dehydrogenase family protein [Anaerolineales bacterium]|nr:UDP-glucose/GDP-mannose dehydrogenase family protein [Anaerolineales bacterium]
MRKICVIGVGYVGLVTGTCFADLGNRVTALDINEERISNLKKGILPIYEPGLEEMVKRNVAAGRLAFTTDYDEALAEAEIAFIAVGTPEGVDGEADLKYVRSAAEQIAQHMKEPLIIVNKSTVPVGTGDWVSDIVTSSLTAPVPFSVVSCPEFLREGSAIVDFMNPARIVLGSLDKEAAHKVADLHLSLRAPIVVTDLRTAEMIKYASNAFLATKISFINEIANICEALGADVKEVAAGMGYDPRIGRGFLDAGLGYGGSCFPKDVKALAYMATVQGKHPQLLQAVMEINKYQRRQILLKLREMLGGSLKGKTVGLLGLAFKPNTDDMREAPSVEIARAIISEGGKVKAYDPVAMEHAANHTPDVAMGTDAYEVATGADALVLVTEWNEFKQLDLSRLKTLMKQPIMVDGRNLYDPVVMHNHGFIYRGMGRGYNGR